MNKLLITMLVAAIVLMTGCTDSSKTNQFMVPQDQPATGITFGWYVADSMAQSLVGPKYTPKIVNEKGECLIMFFVATGDEHNMGGKSVGGFKVAHLLVPVIGMSGLPLNKTDSIEATLVCPLTILDEGKELFNKFNEHGFGMVRGNIDLSVEESDEDITVRGTITTKVGENTLFANFEKLPVDFNAVTAVINPAAEKLTYFYGEEHSSRYENGKGFLKSEGNTFYSGLNLFNTPYFITFDKEIYWDFYFSGN
jgi:hypothetical protein